MFLTLSQNSIINIMAVLLVIACYFALRFLFQYNSAKKYIKELRLVSKINLDSVNRSEKEIDRLNKVVLKSKDISKLRFGVLTEDKELELARCVTVRTKVAPSGEVLSVKASVRRKVEGNYKDIPVVLDIAD